MKLLKIAKRTVKAIRKKGFGYALERIKVKLDPPDGSKKYNIRRYSERELAKQRKTKFAVMPKFSILLAIADQKIISKNIFSVLDQSYPDYEFLIGFGKNTKAEISKFGVLGDERIKCFESDLDSAFEIYRMLADHSSGDHICILDQNTVLSPAALYEIAKSVNEKNADFIYADEAYYSDDDPEKIVSAFHKPQILPDSLRGGNYVGSFFSFDAKLDADKALFGNADSGFYDAVLRLSEKSKIPDRIPIVLSFVPFGKPKKDETKALQEHIIRLGLNGTAKKGKINGCYQIDYELEEKPLISIIIPNKDHSDDLKKCINSIKERSSYENYEIIIVENNSIEKETFDYYHSLEKDPQIKMLKWDKPFNYSAINNYAVQSAKGKYLILLNNDVEIISSDWMEEMLSFNQRKDVGAVGAMLYYPDDTVQHAGVIIGLMGAAGHSHKLCKRGDRGYNDRLLISQNYEAVTAACLMTKKELYEKVGGLDENYSVAYNDVDYCLKLRKSGYFIVWTPKAELYHYESKSRGKDDDPRKIARAEKEMERFRNAWEFELDSGDPSYNPNLTLDREDFSAK